MSTAYVAQANDRVWRTNELREYPRTIVLRPLGTTALVGGAQTSVDAVLVVENGLVVATYSVPTALDIFRRERFHEIHTAWTEARARWVSYGSSASTNFANFPHIVPGLRVVASYPVSEPTLPAVFWSTSAYTTPDTGAALESAAAAWGWTEVT